MMARPKQFSDAKGVTVVLPNKLLARIERAASDDFARRTDFMRKLLIDGVARYEGRQRVAASGRKDLMEAAWDEGVRRAGLA
jgi:metal-responsive CopG/Arc/MetJ family transcriptional regulator